MSSNAPEITCILNVFKRFSIFDEQLAAVRSQTIQPKRIIVWNNTPEHHDALMKYASDDLIIVTTSRNMGVWARFFALYPLLSGQFVCVFDDDTMPGARWFENCVDTMNTYNALLGTIGVIFQPGDTYERERRVGWDEPNETAEYADIVGHSWFFKREWISTLMKELPNIDEKYLTCGEDMHLSYTLRKYLHIPTIVPPHPKSNKTLWGADKAKSWKYGNWNSTFCDTGIGKFHEAITDYQARGLEKIRTRENAIRKWSTCLDYFLDKLRRREPFSIMRYADGEKYVLDNTTLTNCDHWTFRSGSILNKQLFNALKMTNTNVYYGVSGPSDCSETYKYYYNTILNKSNITYANIFVNQNYQKWVQFLKEFDTECVVISCNRPASGKIGAVRVLEHVAISDKLVDDWDARCEEYTSIMKTLAARYNRTLFFVSAGPLSEVFIQTMYELNPDNTYLDVGSSIDEFTKGLITRPYQTSNDSSSGVKDLYAVAVDVVKQLETTFTKIYESDSWNMGQQESKSGLGSTLTFTQNIRKTLTEYIRDWSIQTMVDTSCGDWNWMKHIKDSLPDYTGIDIVSSIVEQNNKEFSSSNIKFVNTDFLTHIKSLPDKSVDLILCRHTLEHLPTQYNIDFMNECKRVCTYLLVTNYEKEGTPNVEVPASVYRPINLRRSPYAEILIPYYHAKFYDGPSDRHLEEMYMHVYKFN